MTAPCHFAYQNFCRSPQDAARHSRNENGDYVAYVDARRSAGVRFLPDEVSCCLDTNGVMGRATTCNECLLMLAEYSEATGAYQRAVRDYRSAVASGISTELDAAKAIAHKSHMDVQDARIAYSNHRATHAAEPE
jgi:hypothetical protein